MTAQPPTKGGPLNRFTNIYNFNTTTSIPPLTDKVIIVTGGNSGVGKESVLQLATHQPSKIYLAARSKSRYDAALADITASIGIEAASRIHHLEIDLGSFTSIKRAADTFLSENSRLDILMNNAGIMANPPGLTEQGYEIQFGTNHLGTALLTHLLLPLILSTASSNPDTTVRVINVSSAAVRVAPRTTGIPFLDSPARHHEITLPTAGHRWTYTRYGSSKVANVLHARGLARRYNATTQHPNFIAVSVHPGRVDTALLSARFNYSVWDVTGWFQWCADWVTGVLDVGDGAMNQLWAATAPAGEQVESGKFYFPVGVEEKIGFEETEERLWRWQEGVFETWLRENP